jgi:hypothetical protein
LKLALAAPSRGVAARRGWSTTSLFAWSSPSATSPPIACAPSSSNRSKRQVRRQGMLMASRWCRVVVPPDGIDNTVCCVGRPLPMRCRTFRRSSQVAASIACLSRTWWPNVVSHRGAFGAVVLGTLLVTARGFAVRRQPWSTSVAAGDRVFPAAAAFGPSGAVWIRERLHQDCG